MSVDVLSEAPIITVNPDDTNTIEISNKDYFVVSNGDTISVAEDVSPVIKVVSPNEAIYNPYFDEAPPLTDYITITPTSEAISIHLSWVATYAPNHHITEVWRSTTNNLSGATLVGSVIGNTFTDVVEPRITYYYWLKSVNHRGITGTTSNSVSGITSANVLGLASHIYSNMDFSDIFTVTEDSIQRTVSQAVTVERDSRIAQYNSFVTLFSDEQTTLASAVNNLSVKVDDEAIARESAVTSERLARIGATDVLATNISTLDAKITTETSAREGAITSLQQVVADDKALLLQRWDTMYGYIVDEGIAREASINSTKNILLNNIASVAESVDELSTSFATDLATAIGSFTNQVSVITNSFETLVTDTQNLYSSFTTNIASSVSQINDKQTLLNTKYEAQAIKQSELEANYTSLAGALVTTNASISTLEQTQSNALGALATRVNELSSATASQFDSAKIWYFDTGVDGWTGTGVNPTTPVSGWLRYASTATDTKLSSPSSLSVDGSAYSQIRFRIRKVGNPVWGGNFRWTTTVSTLFDATKQVIVAAPTFDENGVADLSINVASTDWIGKTITRIQIQLATAVSATDYFEIDWAAIGRPAPGASVAELSTLQQTVTTNNSSASTSITKLQNSLVYSTAIPTDFSAGMDNWVSTRHGDPASIATNTYGTIVSDSDFGKALEITNFTSVGNNILTKGVIHVVPGRVYEIRARFKVTASDGSVQFNTIAGCMPSDYSSSLSPNYMVSNPVTVTDSSVIEVVSKCSTVAGSGILTIPAGTVYFRYGLRLHSNESGLTFRVGSIVCYDITETNEIRALTTANSDATTALDSRVDTVEGTLTSQSTSITNLRGSINAYAISPNSTFENWSSTLPTGWTNWAGSSQISKHTGSYAYSGGNAIQMYSTGTESVGITAIIPATNSSDSTYVDVDLVFTLIAGTSLKGAGLLVSWVAEDTTYVQSVVRLGDLYPDGTITLNKKYVVNTRLTKPVVVGKIFSYYQITLVGNFNGATGPGTAKTIIYDYLSVYSSDASAAAITTLQERVTITESYSGNITSLQNELRNARWTRDYTGLKSGVVLPLLYFDGTALPTTLGGTGARAKFLATAVVSSTATVTQTIAEFSYDGTAWQVRQISNLGQTSNHPVFIIDGGVPAVTNNYTGSTIYTTNVIMENILLGGSYTGNANAIQSLSNRVLAAEGGISSQSDSIISLNNSLSTTNGNVTAAQTAAQNAYDLANTKGKVLVQSAAPTAEDQASQNLWIDTTGSTNTPKRWNGTAWVAVTDKVATDAATAATNAQLSANTANNLLADIASDSKLTASEKIAVRKEWDVVSSEKSQLNTQASTFSITTENNNYNTAFQALATYLNNGTTWVSGVPNWIADTNLGTTTTIVGSTFRSNWAAYYSARTTLLAAIDVASKTLADSKGKVLVQSTTPIAADQLAQNLWIDTTGGNNTPKRWNGTGWVAVTDKVATDAATAAANALSGLSNKANTSALTALSDTVTIQGNAITAQSNLTTDLSSRFNVKSLNSNATFGDWPSGSTLPTGYTDWGGSSYLTQHTGAYAYSSSKAIRYVTNATGDAGFYALYAHSASPNYQYIDIEVVFTLVSGSLSGAGVLFDWNNTSTNFRVVLPFKDKYVASEIIGKKTVCKFRCTRPLGYTGTFSHYHCYLMANYDGDNLGTKATKEIIFDSITIQNSDGSADAYSLLESRVTSVEGTSSSQSNSITSLKSELVQKTNALDFSGWSPGTYGNQGSAGAGNYWQANTGTGVVNTITYLPGPFDVPEMQWKSTAGTDKTGPSGGFDIFVPGEKLSAKRGAVFYAFVKHDGPRAGSDAGPFYLGAPLYSKVSSLANVADPNPYFFIVNPDNVMQPNEWYLAYGVIQPMGSGVADSGVGGLYRLSTGEKVLSATEYRANSSFGVGDNVFRSYHYYSNQSGRSFWWTRLAIVPADSAPTPYELMRQDKRLPAVSTAVSTLTSRIDDGSTGLIATANRTTVLESNVPGSGNLIPTDTEFTRSTSDWLMWSQYGEASIFERNLAGSSYTPSGTNQIGVYASGAPTGFFDMYSPFISVVPNTKYCFSVYVAGYRCDMRIYIDWFTAVNGSELSAVNTYVDNPTDGGGTSLTGWFRPSVFGTAPANATAARLIVRMYRKANQTNPYMWICRPMFSQVPSSTTVAPLYSPSGAPSGYAKIVDDISTLATDNGIIKARKFLTMDVNGYVTGYSTYNDGTTSEFKLDIGKFVIAKPGTTGNTYPFEVDTNTGQTIIQNALIGTAAINDANIGSLTVEKIIQQGLSEDISQISTVPVGLTGGVTFDTLQTYTTPNTTRSRKYIATAVLSLTGSGNTQVSIMGLTHTGKPFTPAFTVPIYGTSWGSRSTTGTVDWSVTNGDSSSYAAPTNFLSIAAGQIVVFKSGSTILGVGKVSATSYSAVYSVTAGVWGHTLVLATSWCARFSTADMDRIDVYSAGSAPYAIMGSMSAYLQLSSTASNVSIPLPTMPRNSGGFTAYLCASAGGATCVSSELNIIGVR